MRFVFTLLLCGWGWSLLGQAVPKKPNIIFILVDDLGYGDVGVFNQNARKQQDDPAVASLATPSLDKMAANGAFFTSQYANAPVCVSSRSSLLTGVHQGNAVVRNNQFDRALEDNHNMATTLKTLGYKTVAIGKWGLQGNARTDWPAHPLKRGFDYYFGYMRHADGHEHYPKEGLYRGVKEVYDNYENVTNDLDKCYTGDLWTARAKQWIIDQTRVKHAAPFFMYLAYDTPHAVLELPTQAYPAGAGLKGGVQWTGKAGKMINTASGEIDSWMPPEFSNAKYLDKTTGEMIPWTDVNKRYATVVQRLDTQIGDLLQLLKDLKIDKNTLVVFTSDNGPAAESYLKESYTPEFFNGYGPFDGIKRDLLEGGMRVPTIVQWTGKIAAGGKIATPSMLSDWLPSFIDAAGAAAPARADGRSLIPLLLNGTALPSRILYAEYFFDGKTPDYPGFDEKHRKKNRQEMQFLRKDNWVGVRYDIKNEEDDFEIFDITSDPKQQKNLAALRTDLQKLFKAKAIQMRRVDGQARRPYDSAYAPGVADAAKGIGVNFFSGRSYWTPGPSLVKTGKQGAVTIIDGVFTPSSLSDIFVYSGFIKIDKKGAYDFYLSTEGNAFMRIHDAAVIDADYGYEARKERKGTMRLDAGLHPFQIIYRRNTQKPFLKLEWSSGNFAKRPVAKGDFL